MCENGAMIKSFEICLLLTVLIAVAVVLKGAFHSLWELEPNAMYSFRDSVLLAIHKLDVCMNLDSSLNRICDACACLR